MLPVVEGAAENIAQLVVDRITLVVGGRVGFKEAFHSNIQTRHDSVGEGVFGSVHLGTGISDVIIG